MRSDRRVLAAQVADEVVEGQARVDDVLDDEDVLAFDARREVLEDAHEAGRFGRGAAVGADLHQVDPDRDVDGAHEVGHERQRSLEHRDEGQLPAGVVGADPRPELADLAPGSASSVSRISPMSACRSTVVGHRGHRRSVSDRRAGRRRTGGRARRRRLESRAATASGATSTSTPRHAVATWPERAGQRVDQGESTVLEHERPEVARVEQLDVEVRVQLAQAAQLAVLLAHELLAERRHLEVAGRGRAGRSPARSSRRRRRRGSTGSGTCAARTPSGRRRSRGSGPSPLRWRGRRSASPGVDPDPAGRDARAAGGGGHAVRSRTEAIAGIHRPTV